MKALKSSVGELWEKTLQWLVVASYMTFLLTGALAGWLVWLFFVVYVPILRYPMLLYIAWIYYDRKSGELGERRSAWFRRLRFWKFYVDYFPAKLHKTADLPPDKNYLLCVFPHGVLCIGAFCAFGNYYGYFTKMFHGLDTYFATLTQHFITPFIREYSMHIGGLPASARCLNYILGTKKGVAITLMVGGAHEAFYSKPGMYKVYLKKRKGFVKIAYKNGTSLVPVVSFGETDVYDQVQYAEGSFLRKAQEFVKKLTGVSPILFYGQFSIVPFRKPVNVVVGKPIPVEKIEDPTPEQVDSLHSKFMEELTKLFESEKHKYIENAKNTYLEIL